MASISVFDIVSAAARLAKSATKTPVLTSSVANQMLGGTCFFKCENFQRSGSFKFRGAFNAISRLDKHVRRRGVITYSTGNHAQAVALSAQLLDTKAVVLMPEDVPTSKLNSTRDFGAEILLYDRKRDDRDEICRSIIADKGYHFIPPFDDDDVIAGQGTVALELFDELGELDYLFVPLGGGGLLAGSVIAAAELSPGCKVIGVEPVSADDGARSIRQRSIVKILPPDSIADGALAQSVGIRNFKIILDRVHDAVSVTDAALIDAMRFLADSMRIVVEPTGCLGLAGALMSNIDFSGKRIGIVLSGGNIEFSKFAGYLLD